MEDECDGGAGGVSWMREQGRQGPPWCGSVWGQEHDENEGDGAQGGLSQKGDAGVDESLV